MKTQYVILSIIGIVVVFYIASQANGDWLLSAKNSKNKPIIQGG